MRQIGETTQGGFWNGQKNPRTEAGQGCYISAHEQQREHHRRLERRLKNCRQFRAGDDRGGQRQRGSHAQHDKQPRLFQPGKARVAA